MPGDTSAVVDFGTGVDLQTLGPERRFGRVVGGDNGVAAVFDIVFADPSVLAASRNEWSGRGGVLGRVGEGASV